MLESAESYLELNEVDVELAEMDMEQEAPEVDDDEQEDWMLIQQLPRVSDDPVLQQIQLNQDQDIPEEHYQYWHLDDQYYTQIELDRMATWLQNRKSAEVNRDLFQVEPVNIDHLNRQQRFAYDIVQDYLIRGVQLLMRIEGFAGIYSLFIIKFLS